VLHVSENEDALHAIAQVDIPVELLKSQTHEYVVLSEESVQAELILDVTGALLQFFILVVIFKVLQVLDLSNCKYTASPFQPY
jgi:hypothetical protein